ncbi:hypothetical protein Ct61P_15080 [Colletotrichum tofieldiae]|nr:hypothetical protein Ct61P_15080 [Colletotrichum tofieldiae]
MGLFWNRSEQIRTDKLERMKGVKVGGVQCGGLGLEEDDRDGITVVRPVQLYKFEIHMVAEQLAV